MVLAGAVLLLTFATVAVQGPWRSPNAFALIRWIGAALGAAGLGVWALRNRLPELVTRLPALAGGLLVMVVLGIAPELIAPPTHGIGDRLWGIPTLFGLPVAGALLLRARGVAARGLAAAALLLPIIGLVAPHDIIGDLRPALSHHIARSHTSAGLGISGLVTLCALGLGAVYATANERQSPLRVLAGAGLLAALPLWSLARVGLNLSAGLPTAGPTAALLLTSAASLWLLAGADEADSPGHPRWLAVWTPRVLEAAAVLSVVGLWLLLKAFTWRWSTTDENIYFYEAWLVTQGQLPYRDFFFAHPPLHLAPAAATIALFGFSITAVKLVPVVATLLTGLLIWALARRYHGPLAAILALGALLFSFVVLQASTNMNGVNLTSLWVTGGIVCLVLRRPVLCGLMLAFGVCTGFYAIAAALGVCVMAWFSTWRTGLIVTAVFVGVALAINGACWALGGEAYIDGVYRYHLEKHNRPLAVTLMKALHYHPHLFLGVLLAPLAAAWQRWRRIEIPGARLEPESAGSWFNPRKLFDEPATGAIRIVWLIFCALLVEFLQFRELYDFYLALLVPTAALCTGYVVALLIAGTLHEARELARGRLSRMALGTVAIGCAFAMALPISRESAWVFGSGRRSIIAEIRLPEPVARQQRQGLASYYRALRLYRLRADHRSRLIRDTFPDAKTRRRARQLLSSPALSNDTFRRRARAERWSRARLRAERAAQRLRARIALQIRRKLVRDGRLLVVASEVTGHRVVSEPLQRGERRFYDWVGASHLNAIAEPIVRALFWRESRRRWEIGPGYRRFLWQKSLHVSVMDELADDVRRMTEEHETVAGGSLIAPAVALASGRRVAGNFVDTNAKRFRTNNTSMKAFFEAICADDVRILVGAPGSFLNAWNLGHTPTVKRYFEALPPVEDDMNKFSKRFPITLFRRTGPRCRYLCAYDRHCPEGEKCKAERCE